MLNIQEIQQLLIEYAMSIGIDKVRFTTADPFLEMKNRLTCKQELNYESGFEEADIELRTEPKLFLSRAESIISVELTGNVICKN